MLTRGRTSALVSVLVLAVVSVACGGDRDDDAAELPAEVTDPTTAPDPDLLLPPLEDYATEEVDPGELEASLDHASVPYEEVRRRVVVDEQGFTVGEVTVVTVEPEAEGPDPMLDHRYGDAPRTAVELAGVQMLRVEAEPHAALAWTEPGFAAMFERGGERSDEWLEDLARATVETIREHGT